MSQTAQQVLARLRRQIQEVTAGQLFQEFQTGSKCYLVDIRDPDEYPEGCLPGAVCLPRNLLELRLEERVTTDRKAPFVLYCATGSRSMLAAVDLMQMGYTRVCSLAGGFAAWKEAGFPVERASVQPLSPPFSLPEETAVAGFYRLPPQLLDELDLYRLEVERFQEKAITDEAFKAFRVPWGIYSQRGGQSYMMRIKLPAGGLMPVQVEAIADLSVHFGDGVPHVTNRQDVQLHGVALADTPRVLTALSRVGLTTRGGGGNTIRNITACAKAGICPQEAFDVTPYAVALSECYLADPRSGVLPRKFKIAFSGCPDDCALASVNDLGFIARIRQVEGRTEQGFAVYAAGGMGAHSRVADLIEEFVPAAEVTHVTEALLRLFDRLGDRRHRNRARLRFVAERLGSEAFRELYQEELRQVRAEPPPLLVWREPPGGVREPFAPIPEEEFDFSKEAPGFQPWFRTAVHPQRQKGYYCAEVRLPVGVLSAQQLRALARLLPCFGEGTVRTTHRQNLLLRWLRRDELAPLYRALQEMGLARPHASGVADVLSCPGAATCNLGICLSRSMALQIAGRLEGDGWPWEELQDIDIRVSGCPNACGQHPIGTIGLQGMARRIAGRPAPWYRIFLGGRVEEGKTLLGKEAGAVPARQVPELLHTFLHHYLTARKADESFPAFLERRGQQDMEELVRQRVEKSSPAQPPEVFVDWGAGQVFSLAGLGPGECGAGVRDLVAADLGDAGRYLYRARRTLQEGAAGDPVADLSQALRLAAGALLVTRGVQPESDTGIFRQFQEKFIDAGLVPDTWADIAEVAAKLRDRVLSGETACDRVEAFVEQVRKLRDHLA